jgi:zinc/manganese transport system substrate-binding protein
MHKLLVASLAALLVPLPAFAAVKVVATTQDIAAITQAVGGSNVDVTYVARGDLDPHFIDAKPSFMVKLASADLVECVGMELEVGWLPPLLTGARNPKVQPGAPGYLDVSTGITPIEVPTGSIDRSRGDLHAAGNPHYWLDPENGRGMARVIEARLAQIDPSHAGDYQAGLSAFETQLTAKEADWNAKMAPLRGAAVIGYHSTFDYLVNRYGMKLIGFVEPKPGIPPTPSHTLELASMAKQAGVRFVFIEPFHNAGDAAPIAAASGAKVVVLPSSVGAESDIRTYFDLFDHIVRDLAGA